MMNETHQSGEGAAAVAQSAAHCVLFRIHFRAHKHLPPSRGHSQPPPPRPAPHTCACLALSATNEQPLPIMQPLPRPHSCSPLTFSYSRTARGGPVSASPCCAAPEASPSPPLRPLLLLCPPPLHLPPLQLWLRQPPHLLPPLLLPLPPLLPLLPPLHPLPPQPPPPLGCQR